MPRQMLLREHLRVFPDVQPVLGHPQLAGLHPHRDKGVTTDKPLQETSSDPLCIPNAGDVFSSFMLE